MTFGFFFHAFDILYIKKLNSEELFQGVGGNEHILLGGGHHPDTPPARLSSLLWCPALACGLSSVTLPL